MLCLRKTGYSNLQSKLGSGSKFSWGISIDDMWRYAGVHPPESVVIPYLLSARSQSGQFTLPPHSDRADNCEDISTIHTPITDASNYLDTCRSSEALASFLKKQRVGFVRCWFPWNFFERFSKVQSSARPDGSLAPDLSSNYRFPLDDFISKMDEAGIGIIAVLGNGYSRFLPTGLGTNKLDEYVKRLTDSSTQIVRHYKDKVKVWQIENEPNWWRAHYTIQWRKGRIWLEAKSQEAILSALYNVVRSECPSSTIMINLEADSKRFRFSRFFPRLTAPMDWKLYAKYCDILGLDLYPNYSSSAPIDASVISRAAMQARRETGLPIFVIETGYPTGPRLLGYNEEKQAKYISSACEQAFSSDSVSGLGVFRFSDSHWKSFPFHENHFGLLTRFGKPKRGWNEYVDQIKQK